MAEATDDYLYSFRLLRDFADYIALNVSSPNTPGLRELQEPGNGALVVAPGNSRCEPKPAPSR